MGGGGNKTLWGRQDLHSLLGILKFFARLMHETFGNSSFPTEIGHAALTVEPKSSGTMKILIFICLPDSAPFPLSSRRLKNPGGDPSSSTFGQADSSIFHW
jgi:hypothetical protein